jgi:heat shock protein HslJ
MTRTHLFLALAGVLVTPLASHACEAGAPTLEQGASISVGRMADLVWSVREVNGRPVAQGAWLTVTPDGMLSGNAGCNRMTGTADLDAGVMEFGPLAVTEMACEADKMDLEAIVLAALPEVRWFAVGQDGTLYLQRQDGATVMCLG